jgi:hypothetical protein
VGRAPEAIERTVMSVMPSDDIVKKFVDVGVDHLIVSLGQPYDLSGVESAMKAAGK